VIVEVPLKPKPFYDTSMIWLPQIGENQLLKVCTFLIELQTPVFIIEIILCPRVSQFFLIMTKKKMFRISVLASYLLFCFLRLR